MDYPFEKRECEVLPPLYLNERPNHELIFGDEEICCLKCEKIYEFPKFKDDYLAHLFLEHRLVIADVEDISDLKGYLKYWCQQFKGHTLDFYCTTLLLNQLPDGTPAKNEKYYLLSDIHPKDEEIRKQLHEKVLVRTLTRYQFERTDRDFKKECLYCRDVIKGLRADYLEHLFKKHFLLLGKPQNLVYIDELIAKVQRNLEQLVCLYCEKTFKDRVTLKDHMRKKGHKRINPNNPNYDKYFLINYRTEKPKHSKTINTKKSQPNRVHGSNNDPCSPTRKSQESINTNLEQSGEGSIIYFNKRLPDSDESDSDWSDWDEKGQPPLSCLYCSQKKCDFADLKKHMLQRHQVDFDASVKGLNFYHKVKIVNYIRRQVCLRRCVTCNYRFISAESLLDHMSTENHFGVGTRKQWDKPEYFFPTYDDDGVLCVLEDNSNDVEETAVRIISEESLAKINKDAERLSLENFAYP